MSNMRLLADHSITSDVASVEIENVFSEDFDTYKIVSSGILLSSTGGTNINFRLLDSTGLPVISSNYTVAIYNLKSGGSFSDNNRGTGNTSVGFFFGRAGAGGQSTGTQATLFNPFSTSIMTFGFFENVYNNNNINQEGSKGVFTYTDEARHTGIQAYATSNMSAGNFRIFGIRRNS